MLTVEDGLSEATALADGQFPGELLMNLDCLGPRRLRSRNPIEIAILVSPIRQQGRLCTLL